MEASALYAHIPVCMNWLQAQLCSSASDVLIHLYPAPSLPPSLPAYLSLQIETAPVPRHRVRGPHPGFHLPVRAPLDAHGLHRYTRLRAGLHRLGSSEPSRRLLLRRPFLLLAVHVHRPLHLQQLDDPGLLLPTICKHFRVGARVGERPAARQRGLPLRQRLLHIPQVFYVLHRFFYLGILQLGPLRKPGSNRFLMHYIPCVSVAFAGWLLRSTYVCDHVVQSIIRSN